MLTTSCRKEGRLGEFGVRDHSLAWYRYTPDFIRLSRSNYFAR
jgi:hypothetical protein